MFKNIKNIKNLERKVINFFGHVERRLSLAKKITLRDRALRVILGQQSQQACVTDLPTSAVAVPASVWNKLSDPEHPAEVPASVWKKLSHFFPFWQYQQAYVTQLSSSVAAVPACLWNKSPHFRLAVPAI